MDDKNKSQNQEEVNDGAIALNIISWVFGTVFFCIGIVNTFWGNDPGFGIFIVLLSFVYFLPVNTILNKFLGFTIPGLRIIKILLGAFIFWAAMGVGDLFDKIELMMRDL